MNIEPTKVFDLGLDDNNRSRIITVCHFIKYGILGIIDSDFDFLKPSQYSYLHLLQTDYSSIEGYCFNEETLEKIFLGYPSKQVEDYMLFLKILGDILAELFFIRFTKETLAKEKTYLAFDDKKYLFIKGKMITPIP
ncbi:MAG: DUF4435 domain-containing protein [Sulfurovum sp.]|nr:DUF4435 domain-containing protein [Sulfurovum sp.]